MFDSVTEDFIKEIPHLNGIDEERLPLELTKIYSNIVSVKSQLERGKLQLTEQNYLEYLQFLDKLIVGLEVLLFQSRYLSHRKNIAFVIATAYKLKSMFIDKEDVKCDVNFDFVSSNLISVLLFLVADDFAGSIEAVNSIEETDDYSGKLVALLRILLSGRISELSNIELMKPMLDMKYMQKCANDLLMWYLCESLQDAISYFYGESTTLNLSKINQVIDLCSFKIDQIEQEDTYLGVLKLAKYLKLALLNLENYSVFNFPSPNGVNESVWKVFLERLGDSGRAFLWPNHVNAVSKGFLEKGISSVITFPTGAGKSTLVDLKIACSVLRGERVVYIVPTHALESQVNQKVRKLFGDIEDGLDDIFIGGEFSQITDVEKNRILVATPERFLSLLSDSSLSIEDVGLFVFDEFHLIGYEQTDNLRNLSAMLMLLTALNTFGEADFVLISAMVENGKSIAEWIADCTQHECLLLDEKWKPTRQLQGCLLYKKSQIDDLEKIISQGTDKGKKLKQKLHATPYCLFSLKTKWDSEEASNYNLLRLLNRDVPLKVGKYLNLTANRNEVAANIATSFARANLKVLVFVASPNYTGSIQRLIDAELGKCSLERFSNNEEKSQLSDEFGDFFISYLKDTSCAIHHGLLLPLERKIMEEFFKKGKVKVMVATPTLAQGINLPADMVIIAGDNRFDPNGKNMESLQAHEILNAVGRAGRAGLCSYGSAILIPGEVVSINENLIDSHWFKLKDNIFSKGDACFEIEDPLGVLMKEVVENGHPINKEQEIFIHRLGGEKNDDKSLLNKSFAAYKAKANSKLQKFSALKAKFLPYLDNSDNENDDLLKLAIRFGTSCDIIKNLNWFIAQYNDRDIEDLRPINLIGDFFIKSEDVIIFSLEAEFESLLSNPQAIEFLKRICSCPFEEHLQSKHFVQIGNLVIAYMQGKNYQELYDMMAHPCRKDEHLDYVRKFVLSVIPSISYIFGIISVLLQTYYVTFGHSDDEFPYELKCIATLVKEGVDSMEKLKFMKKNHLMRVSCHKRFQE